MTATEKEAFLKQEGENNEHHHEEHAKNTLWVEGHAHDCAMDVNSKSPLASCRGNKPPKDNYHPYVGAAE